MRVLLLNQFFWPDSAATSQLLTDTARECARLDWEVTAVCGGSGYAESSDTSAPGVRNIRIIRTRTFRFGRTRTTRLASYLSYWVGALWHGLRFPAGGTVLTLTTPPLLAVIGSLMKGLRGSRHFIWEMDVYPEIAVALGVLRPGGVLDRSARTLALWSRRRADGVIVLGEEMKELLIRQGVGANKIHVCHNWADGVEITPLPFPEGPLCCHYSGNLGLAHDIETICGAMAAVRDDSRFRFIFAGSGPCRAEVERFCRDSGIASAWFRPYCSRAGLGGSLGEGHLGLVTQKAETLGCVTPSKTYGILAAGRPVLFVGPREATPARIIRESQCGWHFEPGDVQGVVDLLRALEGRRELVYAAGARARRAFELQFDRVRGVGRVCAVLGGWEAEVPALTEVARQAH